MRLKVLILLGIVFQLDSVAQQVKLQGQVAIHNSKYHTGKIEYVQNASIKAPFTKPSTSDALGKFSLEFVGLDPGTAIQLQVEKAGLEVVNKYDLQEVIISRKLPLNIYLTTKGQLAEAQTELYNISKKALYAKRDALIAKLRKGAEESQSAIKELEAYFGHPIESRRQAENELISRIETLEKKLPEFAQQLARKNLDFASDIYIKAYEFYEQGAIEKAIEALDSTSLHTSYKRARQDIERSKNLSAIADDLNQKAQLQIQQIAESYELKANAYYVVFQYEKAAAVFEKLAKIYEENDIDPLKLAMIYDELATTYYQDGRFEVAKQKQLKALVIKENLPTITKEDLILSYNMLAQIYRVLNDNDKALDYQQKSIALYQSDKERDTSELSILYSNLALIYEDMAVYDKAYDFQKRAIDIKTRVLDSLDQNLAISYGIMASILRNMNDFENALKFDKKALSIRETVLDSLHPDLANSYNGIGETYRMLGDREQALIYHDKARVIKEAYFQPNHPTLAQTYTNLALTHQQLQQYQKSIDYALKALNIQQHVYGELSPNVAASYSRISRNYSELNHYELAIKNQELAIDIRKKLHKEKTLELAESYYTLGIIYFKTTDYTKSKLYHEEALSIRLERLHEKHPTVADSFYRLAQVNQLLGDYSEALVYFKKVVALDETNYGIHHPYVAQDYIDLARLYLLLNDLSNAEALYAKASESIAEISSGNRGTLEKDLQKLAEDINSKKN